MTNNWHRFSPIPLRIALGVYLMWVGGPIMLDDASRDSTVYTLTQMGLPWAELLVFVVGAVAFFSGLSFFLGAYTRRVAIVQILSFELYLLFGLVQNGYQVLPGEVFVLPTFSASILVLISLVALAVGGPGAWSYEVEQDTDYDPLGVLTPLRWGVGI
ncbi:MAG TPA: DoxX family protein, partial [Anaerolineae bacterium]|nr:DoxX family protein [Anaerolineae bacterium]